jgi:hypothetical protein
MDLSPDTGIVARSRRTPAVLIHPGRLELFNHRSPRTASAAVPNLMITVHMFTQLQSFSSQGRRTKQDASKFFVLGPRERSWPVSD